MMLLETLYTALKEKEVNLKGHFVLEEEMILWIYETEKDDEDSKDTRWDAYCEDRRIIEPIINQWGCVIAETGDYDNQIYIQIKESIPGE